MIFTNNTAYTSLLSITIMGTEFDTVAYRYKMFSYFIFGTVFLTLISLLFININNYLLLFATLVILFILMYFYVKIQNTIIMISRASHRIKYFLRTDKIKHALRTDKIKYVLRVDRTKYVLRTDKIKYFLRTDRAKYVLRADRVIINSDTDTDIKNEILVNDTYILLKSIMAILHVDKADIEYSLENGCVNNLINTV